MDGRKCDEFRSFSLQYNVIPSASGSARLKLHQTDILVAIKAEVGAPDELAPNEGRVVFSVDCSSSMLGTALLGAGLVGGAAALSAVGGGGGAADKRELEAMGKILASQLESIYNQGRAIRKEKLCIIPGKKCWVLSVDCVVFSTSGSLLDALALCLRAALRTTLIPAITVVCTGDGAGSLAKSSSDGTEGKTSASASSAPVRGSGIVGGSSLMGGKSGADEWEVLVDEDPANAKSLARWDRLFPLVVTVNRVGLALVGDASQEEESCASARVSVAIDDKDRVLGTLTTGLGAISADALPAAMKAAAGCVRALRRMFEAAHKLALGEGEHGEGYEQEDDSGVYVDMATGAGPDGM